VGHEKDEDTPHAVEGETLGGFVGEDVGYACGHFFRWERCGEVLCLSHDEFSDYFPVKQFLFCYKGPAILLK
jgi:hypothetical protein